MKRVKQISIDILVDDAVDGVDLADDVAMALEEVGFNIAGYGFNEDLTEDYMDYLPSVFKE